MLMAGEAVWQRRGRTFIYYTKLLALLTFATSPPLNAVVLYQERIKEKRLHRLQCKNLLSMRDELRSMPSSSKLTLEDQRKIANTFMDTKIDPLQLAISPLALPLENASIDALEEQKMTWSRILFGPEFGRKIRRGLGNAYESLVGNRQNVKYRNSRAEYDQADQEEWEKALKEVAEEVKVEDDKQEKLKLSFSPQPIQQNTLKQERQQDVQWQKEQFKSAKFII